MGTLHATFEVTAAAVAVTLAGSTTPIQVGELGRHGYPGYLASDWVTFPGSVLQTPPGARPDDLVQVSFVVPEGWTVANPIGPQGAPLAQVQASCFAAGRFEHRTVGGAELYAWSGLGAARVESLFVGTTSLLAWFERSLDFEPDPYVVVLTPRAPDGEGVFAGASARGVCFDHEEGSKRGWELLAHRIGHAIDRYPPTGFRIAEPEDHWFVEGWASYVEVVATEATELASGRGKLDELRARHRTALAAHPAWDVSLASEPARTGDHAEHLHYVVGPLVAAELDRQLLERTGRTLQDFVRHLHQTAAGRPVHLRTSLQAWSGVALDGFWARWVDAPPPL